MTWTSKNCWSWEQSMQVLLSLLLSILFWELELCITHPVLLTSVCWNSLQGSKSKGQGQGQGQEPRKLCSHFKKNLLKGEEGKLLDGKMFLSNLFEFMWSIFCKSVTVCVWRMGSKLQRSAFNAHASNLIRGWVFFYGTHHACMQVRNWILGVLWEIQVCPMGDTSVSYGIFKRVIRVLLLVVLNLEIRVLLAKGTELLDDGASLEE